MNGVLKAVLLILAVFVVLSIWPAASAALGLVLALAALAGVVLLVSWIFSGAMGLLMVPILLVGLVLGLVGLIVAAPVLLLLAPILLLIGFGLALICGLKLLLLPFV
jgi:hypothetical protein